MPWPSSSPPPLTPPLAPAQRPREAPLPRNLLQGHLLRGGLAGLSAALGLVRGGAALAAPLSDEDTLRLSADSGGGGGSGFELALPDLGLDGLVDFVTRNPLVAAASVAAVALPLVIPQVLGGSSKPYGVVSASAAYRRLLEGPDAQLVDIRLLMDAREVGSPDLGEAKKKAVAMPYDGEDKNGFLKKLAQRFKDPENTTLIILDKTVIFPGLILRRDSDIQFQLRRSIWGWFRWFACHNWSCCSYWFGITCLHKDPTG